MLGNSILTRAEIDAMEGLQKTHFLNPTAQRLNKSLGDAAGLKGFGVHLIEVQPGLETTEHHRHLFEDECVYVLSGRATAISGEEEAEIGPGDFLAYPKGGAAHSIINTGSEPLRCLVIGERLPHDVADYPRLGKRFYRYADAPGQLIDHSDITDVTGSVGKK